MRRLGNFPALDRYYPEPASLARAALHFELKPGETALTVPEGQALNGQKTLANIPIKVVGAGLVATGLGLHFWSMWTLRHWWVEDQLCTMGPFKWFRHPMYAAWITFILPATALLFNSWIILSFVVLIHPIWHQLVIREEKIMVGKFQGEYRAYAERTGRFFPRIWNRSYSLLK